MKNKDFDNILNECLERIMLGGESLEQCLKSYPEQADELKPLLETALMARQASSVEPRPEFKAKARYQFRAALTEKTAPRRRRFWGWMPQWATALAIVLVVLLAGGGTVAAASNSMPDSILYPVKLATENVRLAFTPSELGKARLCAGFADERVAEIVYMAEQGDIELVEATTERLDERLEKLAVLVSRLEADGLNDEPATLSAPKSATTASDAGGSGGETNGADEEPSGHHGGQESAPAPAEPPPTTPTTPTTGEGDEVPEESTFSPWGRSKSADLDVHLDSETKFKIRVSDAAITNPAVLKALLDEVPPSLREALLEAIAISEAGYEAVLQALS